MWIFHSVPAIRSFFAVSLIWFLRFGRGCQRCELFGEHCWTFVIDVEVLFSVPQRLHIVLDFLRRA